MKNRTLNIIVPLIISLPALMLENTATASCPSEARNQFFASYGDSTQTNNGAGSIDDYGAKLWNMPAGFLSLLFPLYGNHNVGTDIGTVDASRPFILAGYDPFSPEDVDWAILRFDFYYTHYSWTEGVGFVDANNNDIMRFYYYPRLQSKLQGEGQDREQWISMRIDLRSGAVFASEIDAFGNVVAEYGEFMTFGTYAGANVPADFGQVSNVLQAAKNGELRGSFFDDMNLSYVAFYGMETVPLQNVWCPDES